MTNDFALQKVTKGEASASPFLLINKYLKSKQSHEDKIHKEADH